MINSGGSETVAHDGLTAGTIISGGTLEIFNSASVGSGPIMFAGTGGKLVPYGDAMPANVISGLLPTDAIDLAGVGFDTAGSASILSGNVLQVIENGTAYDLQLDPLQDFSKAVFQVLPGNVITLEQFRIVSSGQVDSGTTLSAGNLEYVYGTSISATVGGGVQASQARPGSSVAASRRSTAGAPRLTW